MYTPSEKQDATWSSFTYRTGETQEVVISSPASPLALDESYLLAVFLHSLASTRDTISLSGFNTEFPPTILLSFLIGYSKISNGAPFFFLSLYP